jgi:hypothetical protein
MKLIKVKWALRNDEEITGELHSFINTSNGLMGIVIRNKRFFIVAHHELTVI